MTDTSEPTPETPAPPAAPAPAATPVPGAPNWRKLALVAAAVVLVILTATALWHSLQPSEQVADEEAPAIITEEEWPGMADLDRLHVRPETIGRPVASEAMRATILSGYADVEFSVGADGRASDIRIVRESVADLGYAAEARRLVTGARWPTEWRGRTAPYDARYRVIFPPGRANRAIAPISISAPNLTPEILALRRNAEVTLLVRVDESGAVENARVIESDVQSAAVTSEAMRVAMGARFPPNPAGFGYDTQLTVRFDVLGAQAPQETPPVGPVVTLSEVPFTQQPSAGDLNRHYPRRARNAGIGGRVLLACVVQRNLRLACNVAEEDPTGSGFATAALRLSRQFRAAPQFADGRPTVGAQVRVPLVFRAE